MIITIDGPSGTGKSTVAKKIADKLHFTYLDTGAMFRSYAYGILNKRINPLNKNEVVTFIHHTSLHIRGDTTKKQFFLDDLEVTPYLREQDVADAASKISTYAEVRDVLKQLQRSFGHAHDAIFCGRDMGSVIFPDADLKIYLTAQPLVRAERRYNELKATHPHLQSSLSVIDIAKEIEERDARDQNRNIAPLKPASDAYIIDTSNMSITAVVDEILSLWNKKKI